MRIELKDVSYWYGEGLRRSKRGAKVELKAPAVASLSLRIEPGELVAVAGRSGSGKSTLLRLLKGLARPSQGELLADGADPWRLRRLELFDEVGLVMQYPEHQLFAPTVYDDIAFGPRRRFGKRDTERIEPLVLAAMESVGLESDVYRELSPFELSGGEKRRAALAGVLALQPKLLLLDEPTAGLDASGRRALFLLLRSLRERRGTTVLWVTHRLQDTLEQADRLLWLDSGALVRDDTPLRVLGDEAFLAAMGAPQPACLALRTKLAACGIAAGDRPWDAAAVAAAVAAALAARRREAAL